MLTFVVTYAGQQELRRQLYRAEAGGRGTWASRAGRVRILTNLITASAHEALSWDTSSSDDAWRRVEGSHAKAIIYRHQRRWRTGSYVLAAHVQKRMKERDLTVMDVDNIVRCGRVECPAEYNHGSYRYTVETARVPAVFAFRGGEKCVVPVTAWRKDR